MIRYNSKFFQRYWECKTWKLVTKREEKGGEEALIHGESGERDDLNYSHMSLKAHSQVTITHVSI